MKKMLILAATALLLSHSTKAQCPEKVVYTVSKLEMLDSALNITDTKEVTATLETTENGILIHKSTNEADTLAGPITKTTCSWIDPYKNGKVVIIADLHDERENLNSATITIEAVNGKITILLRAVEYPDKLIRLQVDKYEVSPKK